MEEEGPVFLFDLNTSDSCLNCFNSISNQTYSPMLGNDTLNVTIAPMETSQNTSCDITNFRRISLISLGIFGTIGNLLSFTVLQFRYPATSANLYLKALAIADTVFLLTAVVGSTLKYLTPDYCPLAVAILKLLLKYILGDISQFVSVWLTVALSFSRFMAVGRPIRANIYLSYRSAKISMSIILLAAIALEAIKAGLTAQCKEHRSENGTYICYMSVRTMWRIYVQVAHFTGSMFILPAIPLLIFNIGLLRVLVQMRHSQPDNFPGHRREFNEITKTVIWIVVVFLVSYTPYLVWGVLCVVPSFLQYMRDNGCIASKVLAAFAVSYHVNSAVNFLIYLFCKASFQEKLKSMFFGRILQNRGSTRRLTRYSFIPRSQI